MNSFSPASKTQHQARSFVERGIRAADGAARGSTHAVSDAMEAFRAFAGYADAMEAELTALKQRVAALEQAAAAARPDQPGA